MYGLKNLLGTGALAALFAIGGMVAIPSVASAEVACNGNGECWHVSHRYATYPPELGVQFYGDDWRKSHETDAHFHWMHDHDGGGYYSHGEWHEFNK